MFYNENVNNELGHSTDGCSVSFVSHNEKSYYIKDNNKDMSIVCCFYNENSVVMGCDSRSICEVLGRKYLESDNTKKIQFYPELNLAIACSGILQVNEKQWYVAMQEYISEYIEKAEKEKFISFSNIMNFITSKLEDVKHYGSYFCIGQVHNHKANCGVIDTNNRWTLMAPQRIDVFGDLSLINAFFEKTEKPKDNVKCVKMYMRKLLKTTIEVGDLIQKRSAEIGTSALNTCGGTCQIGVLTNDEFDISEF